MKTPVFWFKKDSILKYLLFPLTYIWKAGYKYKKIKATCHSYPIPIICIGNIIMGGGGKTPLVIEVSKDLKKIGKNVHIVYKAFNVKLKINALEVTKDSNPKEVGDEPILASSFSTTWIAKTRKYGIEKAIQNGADVILLDDGFQDYTIKKDFSLLVINSRQNFGNGFLFPSGPLREKIENGINKANCIFYYGNKRNFNKLVPKNKKPVFFVKIKPSKNKLKQLDKKKLIAFAGIAHPSNFFYTLYENNLHVIKKYYFSDHKNYKNNDLEKIINYSKSINSYVLTTEKDYIKVPKKFRSKIDFLPVSVNYDSKKLFKMMEKYVHI